MSKTAPRDPPGGAGGGPDTVDVHVGARIRMRRRFLGMTQHALAESLGLTFQQVQKYERGANRVSASRLFDTARALGVGVTYFFEGLADPVEPGATPSEAPPRDPAREFLFTAEGSELARLFPRLRSAEVRRRLLELARVAAGDNGGDSDAQR